MHTAATTTTTRMRSKTVLAWLGWLATLGCCAGGLLAALLWTRPLTLDTLGQVAVPTLTLQLGLATVGLVLALRRPHNPIGWGCMWPLVWSGRCRPRGRPGSTTWSTAGNRCHWPRSWRPSLGSGCGHPPSRWGSRCRPCCCPTGGCARLAGGWSRLAV